MSTSVNKGNAHSQTTDAFQQSEKLFRALIENSSDALALVSSEGIFTYVSPPVQKILGFAPEELLGRRTTDLIPSDHLAHALERFEVVKTPGLTVTVEHPYLHKDGSPRWLESTITNHLLEPTIQAFVANFRDITERKQAQEAQVNNFALLSAVAEGITDALYVRDLEGYYLMINATGARFLQKTVEEVIGKHYRDLFPPDAAQQLLEHDRSVLESGQTQTNEEIIVREGTARVYLATKGVYRDHQGRIRGIIGISRDITEHKLIQEHLRLSEQRYRTLIEQSPLSVQVFSPDGSTILVNRAWEQLWGVTLEQIAGYNILQDEQLVEKGIMPHIKRGFAGEVTALPAIKYEPEQTIPHVSSVSHRWVRAFLYPVKDEAGQIREMVLIHEDISESKHAEEQVRASEARKGAIVETALDCIISMDHLGRVMEFNPTAERTFGYRRAEALGREMADLIIPPALREQHRQGLRQYLKTGIGSLLDRRTEITAMRADGSEFPVELAITRVPADDPPTFTGYLRDITERKRSEEELRKAKEQLEAIFHNAADGITVQDAHGRIVYVNDVAATLSGFPSAEAMLNAPYATLRQTIQRFAMKDEEGNLFPLEELPGRRALRGERHVQAVLQYVDMLTEHIRWSLVKAEPIFDENGHVQFTVNVITDITERQALEQRKNEFISLASHELKTPVTSLKGFTNILQRRATKQEDTQALHYLARMDAQLNKLTTLIGDLLDLSKIQAGKLEFREERFDLTALVQDIIETMQETTSTHHLTRELAAEAQVFGDRDRIGQVLINLLTNAIKYSPHADNIVVRLSRDQEQVVVSVRDFGIGIAQGQHQKIFERFYQVSDPTEKTFPGLGIGLYISHEIMKRHQGRIWVESIKGEGSTFYVSLPLSAER